MVGRGPYRVQYSNFGERNTYSNQLVSFMRFHVVTVTLLNDLFHINSLQKQQNPMRFDPL